MKTLKCMVCGKFIAYQDIIDELAIHNLLYPLSDLSVETYESYCKKCNSIDGETKWTKNKKQPELDRS